MEVTSGRKFLGRFNHKADLLQEITDLCKKENIRLGTFSIIGAVSKARMGFYDQNKKEYAYCVELEKKLEITACLGNVSLLDNEIFVHAHVQLADHQGTSYGGHLMPGTLIFAAEYYITELVGAELTRQLDPETKLNLWKND